MHLNRTSLNHRTNNRTNSALSSCRTSVTDEHSLRYPFFISSVPLTKTTILEINIWFQLRSSGELWLYKSGVTAECTDISVLLLRIILKVKSSKRSVNEGAGREPVQPPCGFGGRQSRFWRRRRNASTECESSIEDHAKTSRRPQTRRSGRHRSQRLCSLPSSHDSFRKGKYL